jgi:hypothetical protein
MIDFKGNKIEVGDKVIFLEKNDQASRLSEGVIDEFTKMGHIKIKGRWKGVTSQNVYKL